LADVQREVEKEHNRKNEKVEEERAIKQKTAKRIVPPITPIEKQQRIQIDIKKTKQLSGIDSISKFFATTILKANIGWLIGFVLGTAYLTRSQYFWAELSRSSYGYGGFSISTLLGFIIFGAIGGAMGGGFTGILFNRRLPNIMLLHVIIVTIGCAISGAVGGGAYVFLIGDRLDFETFAVVWMFIWAIGWFLGSKIIYWSLVRPQRKR
jgi:hypothetical protein